MSSTQRWGSKKLNDTGGEWVEIAWRQWCPVDGDGAGLEESMNAWWGHTDEIISCEMAPIRVENAAVDLDECLGGVCEAVWIRREREVKDAACVGASVHILRDEEATLASIHYALPLFRLCEGVVELVHRHGSLF